MSLTGAIASALSGLTAQSTRSGIVSSNVANATTPGYGLREVELSARVVQSNGMGVDVTGINRIVDNRVIGERRLSEAEAGRTSALADFYKTVETHIGTADDPQSLNGRIAALDTALLTASAQPENDSALGDVAMSASRLVNVLHDVSNTIQNQRQTADGAIATQVQQLNDTMAKIADLNTKIQMNSATKTDTSALMDQRQQLVDSITSIVPVRELQRENGMIGLMTTNGLLLVDGGSATKMDFTATGVIAPGMTANNGALSGLTIDGRAVDTASPNSLIAGGSLAAQFQIRDSDGVEAQSRIDAVARDLAERFQDPSLDSTRAPGDPGLFTDGANAFDPANEVGLSQRIQLNPVADPSQGGDATHLRDGLGATAPGDAGNAALLNAWEGALTAARPTVSGDFSQGARSFSELSSTFSSIIASSRLDAEGSATFAQNQADAMKTTEKQEGVDTDKQMQDLLQIQQAYTANAKVLSTVDQMLQKLLDM